MNKRLNTIMSEYYQNLDVYQKLSLDVNDIINTLLEVHHIKISNMAIRIKSEEALRNKAMYKNKYAHLDEITDILGVRIITLFENDVDTILELLENTFEVCEIVDKRKRKKATGSNSVIIPSMSSLNLQTAAVSLSNIRNIRTYASKFSFVQCSSMPGQKWNTVSDTNPSMSRR